MTKPNPKTVAEQQARTKEAHPQLQLVPDAAQGDHPKSSEPRCGASRLYAGKTVLCELPTLHAGNHNRGGIWWRARSGDES